MQITRPFQNWKLQTRGKGRMENVGLFLSHMSLLNSQSTTLDMACKLDSNCYHSFKANFLKSIVF